MHKIIKQLYLIAAIGFVYIHNVVEYEIFSAPFSYNFCLYGLNFKKDYNIIDLEIDKNAWSNKIDFWMLFLGKILITMYD